MKKEKMSKLIDFAIDIVDSKEWSDELYKLKSFEIILTKLFDQELNTKSINKTTTDSDTNKTQASVELTTETQTQDAFSDLAKRINVDSDQIYDVFEVKDEEIKIIGLDSSQSNPEKTKQIVLLLLIGYKFHNQSESIALSVIKSNLKLNGIPFANFARTMKPLIPKYIIADKDTYKLTNPGIKKSLELLSTTLSS